MENTDGRPADPTLTTVAMCENSANVGRIQHLQDPLIDNICPVPPVGICRGLERPPYGGPGIQGRDVYVHIGVDHDAGTGRRNTPVRRHAVRFFHTSETEVIGTMTLLLLSTCRLRSRQSL